MKGIERISFPGIVFCMLVVGCVQGPDPSAPTVELPAHIRRVSPGGSNSLGQAPWRRLFADTELQALLEKAVTKHPEIVKASARVDESIARFAAASAARFPSLEGESSGRAYRYAEEEIPGFVIGDRNASRVRVEMRASWEIDWWGRVRRSREAALADFMAVESNREAITTQIVASLASAYFDLLSLNEERLTVRELVKLEKRHEEWVLSQLPDGGRDQRDLLNVRERRINCEIQETRIAGEIRAKENELSFWVGDYPGGILRTGNPYALYKKIRVAPLIPGDALLRRPDILRAAWEHQAAMARIGEQEALRFPSLTITGRTGLLASSARGLLESGASGYAVGPSIVGTIFDGGRGKADVKAAVTRAQATRAEFDAAVLRAFKEAADACDQADQASNIEAKLDELVATLDQARQISMGRGVEGVADGAEIFRAEAKLLHAKMTKNAARRDRLQSVVLLYRVLGGGWK